MIRLLPLLLIPILAFGLSGKHDGLLDYGVFNANGKLLADCRGSQFSVCNQAGEEIAVGYTSSATPPVNDENGVRFYLPDGLCRTVPGSYNFLDVYVMITGSASASSAVVTGDCK